MKEDENNATYFLGVDGFVNTIRGLGEEISKNIQLQLFKRY
jgi:hypothetical protein